VNKQFSHGIKVDIAILQAMVTFISKAIIVILVTKVDMNVSSLFDCNHTYILLRDFYKNHHIQNLKNLRYNFYRYIFVEYL